MKKKWSLKIEQNKVKINQQFFTKSENLNFNLVIRTFTMDLSIVNILENSK